MKNTRNEIKSIIEKNIDVFTDDHSLNDEYLKKIEENFMGRVSGNKRSDILPKRKLKLIPITLVITLCILVTSFVIADIPVVKALKANVVNFFESLVSDNSEYKEGGQIFKKFESIEQLYQNIQFTPPEFVWIPGNFSILSIETTTDENNNWGIYYEYGNGKNDFISISITPYFEPDGVSSFGASSEYLEVTIADNVVYITEKKPYSALMIYKNQYQIGINTNVEKDDLIKIIDNIK